MVHTLSSSPLQFPSVSPYGASVRCSVSVAPSSSMSSYMQSPTPPSPSPSTMSLPSLSNTSLPYQKKMPWHQGLYCIEFANGLGAIAHSNLTQKDTFKYVGGRSWPRENHINANHIRQEQVIDTHSPALYIRYICAAPPKILKVGGRYL
jgi:hypothetical protein